MINHVTLQGRFTKDVKLSESSTSEINYVRFTLAWSEKSKSDKEISCFLDCVTFSHLAEFIAKRFKKGDMVIVEGKLTTHNYEDQSGNKKYKNELKVNKIHFCT